MMTLKLPKKQVNAILVALDTEIQYQFDSGGKPDWEYLPRDGCYDDGILHDTL